MKHIKLALAALAMVAGVGAYATNQNAKDPQLTQGYVSANCPTTGSLTCGDSDGLAEEDINQRTQDNQIVVIHAGDFVSKN